MFKEVEPGSESEITSSKLKQKKEHNNNFSLQVALNAAVKYPGAETLLHSNKARITSAAVKPSS